MTVKVLFMGRKRVAAETLEWLNALAGVEVTGVLTDNHLSVSPTSDVARRLGFDLYSLEEAEVAIDEGRLCFDLGLSVLFWRRIKSVMINAATRGIINFHPAPLPEFKGTGGYNLAILEGWREWAVSAHYVDEQIDTGGIIEVDWFPIDEERETVVTLEAKCQPRLSNLVGRVVHQALEREEPLPVTPNEGGRYISRAEMEAMKEVREGDDVDRKVRAFWFPPYTGAWIKVNGVRCTLVNDAILRSLAEPGSSSLFSAPVNASGGDNGDGPGTA